MKNVKAGLRIRCAHCCGVGWATPRRTLTKWLAVSISTGEDLRGIGGNALDGPVRVHHEPQREPLRLALRWSRNAVNRRQNAALKRARQAVGLAHIAFQLELDQPVQGN